MTARPSPDGEGRRRGHALLRGAICCLREFDFAAIPVIGGASVMAGTLSGQPRRNPHTPMLQNDCNPLSGQP